MPAIYHEGSWLGNATDPEVLVKDTVGWTGKNRAYSQTNNAVIAHIENGITYDVSWTGSATVTLKKNSTSGATITSGSTSPLSFTADADYELYFGSSATVTNIMVKDSRITDPTYEPYHESVQNQLNAQGVLGAKNKFAYPWATKSATLGGITFTDNDGYSLTVNGTATSNTQFDFFNASNRMGGLETGRKYILSGAPETSLNTNDAKLQLTFRDSNDTASSQITVVCPQGGEIEFTIPEGYRPWYFVYYVRSGVTINNLVVKPMIRLASDPDDTYQPYAMTNRELTEKRFEKGILSSGDDLNNITETGIYLVATSVSNVPENRANLTLIVNGFDSTQIRQVLMTREAMYTRSKEGATWKPWYKYTGTVVS